MNRLYEFKTYLFKAIKASSLFSAFILCLLLTTVGYSWGFELKVKNSTTINIYPTVISGESKESFGVVSKGKGKTVGFSQFKLGDTVQISWEIGESYDLSNVVIDSSRLKNIGVNITSVHLIYYGKDIWTLKAFDANGTQVGTVP